MRFGTWLKREHGRANGHIAAGVMLTLGVCLFGPYLLRTLTSSLFASMFDTARWALLAALVVGLVRLAYGMWRRWQLEEAPEHRFHEEHQ